MLDVLKCVHTLDLGLSSHPKDVRVTSPKYFGRLIRTWKSLSLTGLKPRIFRIGVGRATTAPLVLSLEDVLLQQWVNCSLLFFIFYLSLSLLQFLIFKVGCLLHSLREGGCVQETVCLCKAASLCKAFCLLYITVRLCKAFCLLWYIMEAGNLWYSYVGCHVRVSTESIECADLAHRDYFVTSWMNRWTV
jgi:hypothetical protein